MIGKEIYAFAEELWPIDRSLTGEGVRETLRRISEHLPTLKTCEIASGTPVFDWTIPKEWRVNEAYIVTPGGERICDYAQHNLHLLGYSAPYRAKLSLEALQDHLYSLPEQADAIPYVTSYYKERWGFCLSQNQRDQLKPGEYEVVIDTELFDGVLNYGELILPGQSEQEVFLSSYVCHPSMANNELSGPCVLTFLAKWLTGLKHRRYTYRIVFIPETIGSITYLSRHLQTMKECVIAGFNLSCLGDDRAYSYLPSRHGDTLSDRSAQHVLRWLAQDYQRYSWLDRGSDERQYCAPGVDLPVATIMRSKYGQYPEYHTSLDTLGGVVTPTGLDGGYEAVRRALELIERNAAPFSQVLGEPQMGKRGLYSTLSTRDNRTDVKVLMDVLSYCDGHHDVIDIADRLEVPAWLIYDSVDLLAEHDLIAF